MEERLYLGAYEVWRKRLSGNLDEERQTLHVMDGERRVVVAETLTVEGEELVTDPDSYLRYQLCDHLESSRVECDGDGELLTYEQYHPYGTTALRASSGATGFAPKRYRYTGKENDEETRLYYYGARYYPPWLGRWTGCDIRRADWNLYSSMRNGPIRFRDPDGAEALDFLKFKPGPRKGAVDIAIPIVPGILESKHKLQPPIESPTVPGENTSGPWSITYTTDQVYAAIGRADPSLSPGERVLLLAQATQENGLKGSFFNIFGVEFTPSGPKPGQPYYRGNTSWKVTISEYEAHPEKYAEPVSDAGKDPIATQIEDAKKAGKDPATTEIWVTIPGKKRIAYDSLEAAAKGFVREYHARLDVFLNAKDPKLVKLAKDVQAGNVEAFGQLMTYAGIVETADGTKHPIGAYNNNVDPETGKKYSDGIADTYQQVNRDIVRQRPQLRLEF